LLKFQEQLVGKEQAAAPAATTATSQFVPTAGSFVGTVLQIVAAAEVSRDRMYSYYLFYFNSVAGTKP